nr:translation initiation factor IF-2-like [Aegilops tauschii subsp. strangulata]
MPARASHARARLASPLVRPAAAPPCAPAPRFASPPLEPAAAPPCALAQCLRDCRARPASPARKKNAAGCAVRPGAGCCPLAVYAAPPRMPLLLAVVFARARPTASCLRALAGSPLQPIDLRVLCRLPRWPPSACVAPGRLEPGRARPPRVPAQAPTRRLLRAASANRPAPGRLRSCLGRLRASCAPCAPVRTQAGSARAGCLPAPATSAGPPPAGSSAPGRLPAPATRPALRLPAPVRPAACRLQRNRPPAGLTRPRRLPHPTAVVGCQ